MPESSYKILQPPFTLKFWEMSKTELKQYNGWFIGIIPERVRELSRALVQSSTEEDCRLDLTVKSLDCLGAWFATQVEVRRRSPEEVTSSDSSLNEAWQLTNRTFSLAMDVGMYLSQVFLHQHPALRWDQPFGNKKFIDYGQPVLVPFEGNVPLNPIRLVVTLAYAIAKKTKTGKGLRDLYEIRSKSIV